ncbi:hypothetical protein HMPREF0291_10931 [Corynebacterium genitalium ATCC 33030]|uniref:Uncharacterized protein n=1 Tax=Corynebacterium genitalium ATCC 33030 TaxID=585529 RepID=D7WA75_9CORY|nr:hypothetical protein HMPREF0291_10931 [Corynebacterium genitalium ATCC 33030]
MCFFHTIVTHLAFLRHYLVSNVACVSTVSGFVSGVAEREQ